MTPERWKRIEDAFDRALDLPEGERRAFLDSACADDRELRRELELLLENASHAATSLHETVARSAEQFQRTTASTKLATRLGPYRLRELIGEGGMGAVYLASRDDDQFRRDVAIKILRPVAASPLLVARMREERQLLASLDHPNIVRLLDGGSTDDGLPYLVMEHITGVPLTAHAQRLSVRERVELVGQVASAVQYAHQKLVVHRDVKPSNILVDATGKPRLLDFGIAKLLDDDDTREALTRTGMMLYTAEYASPEQARGEPTTVATDVYSLGAVLYELLAGKPPQQRGDTLIETLANICEREPALPSSIAPASVRRELSGDLDNIVLKALQKAPGHRYPSAAALVDDLQRYLAGLPVAARAATVGYRARKYITRHFGKLAIATLVALSLSAAVVVSLLQARRADRNATEANRDKLSLLRDRGIQELASGYANRALPYFGEVLRGGADDPALRFLIAEAMRPLERDIAAVAVREGTNGIAWAPDGKRFALHAERGLTIHTLEGTQLLEIAVAPAGNLLLLAFNSDGTSIVASYSSGVLVGWDAATGAQRFRREVSEIEWTVGWGTNAGGDAVVAARHDGMVRVFDTRSGKELAATQITYELSGSRLAISPDRHGVAIGTKGGDLWLWNLITDELQQLDGHPGGITALSYASDGSKLYSGGADHAISIRDGVTGRHVAKLLGGSAPIAKIAVDMTGTRIATLDGDETATIWDATTRKPIATFGAAERPATIEWSTDGKRVVTTNRIGSFSVWSNRGDLELVFAGTAGGTAKGASRSALDARFSPDGAALLTMSSRDVRVRRVAGGPRLTQFSLPGSPYAVAWSPDQQQLAITGHRLGGIWDAETGKAIATFGVSSAGWDIAWNPTGTEVAIVTDAGEGGIYDARGALIRKLVGHRGRATSVAWSRDGTRLLTAGSDHTARLWDAATGEQRLAIGHPAAVMTARWSPDQTVIATACWDHNIRLWDASSGMLLAVFNMGAQNLLSVTFDPQGQTLAATSRGGDVVLVDRATGARTMTLGGHSDAVPMAVWSPDGGLLATAGYDGKLRIWDPKTGALLATRATGALLSIDWSRDGRRLVDVGEEGEVRIWDTHGADGPVSALLDRMSNRAEFRLVGTQLERMDAMSGR